MGAKCRTRHACILVGLILFQVEPVSSRPTHRKNNDDVTDWSYMLHYNQYSTASISFTNALILILLLKKTKARTAVSVAGKLIYLVQCRAHNMQRVYRHLEHFSFFGLYSPIYMQYFRSFSRFCQRAGPKGQGFSHLEPTCA